MSILPVTSRCIPDTEVENAAAANRIDAPCSAIAATLQASAPGFIHELLDEQAILPAVDTFAHWHESHEQLADRYAALLPTSKPRTGEQYAFEVNLDACTGCKACVVACHSLNGLNETESWRSVGQLISLDRQRSIKQTVTTACHHCVEPACASGCPTLAYGKDALTGIVRHLDDQCIGCSYCTMTCPYEVPQFEPTRGIVRKCDMCRQRLDVGEAPACVQSCPNSAIKIVLVEKADVITATRNTTLLPTAPASNITAPSTRYVSTLPLPSDVVPDLQLLRPQPTHWPLVIMLVLTQWGAGAFVFAWLTGSNAAPGAVIGVIGAGSAVLHLGRPMQAWRAWMGWRTSWLSREILIFGLHGPLAVTYAWFGLSAVGFLAAVTGLVGIISSGMLYHVTQREWWRGVRSVGRFLLTSLVLGSATAAMLGSIAPWVVVASAMLKLAAELRWQRFDNKELALEPCSGSATHEWLLARSLCLLHGELGGLHRGRLLIACFGGVFCPLFWAAQTELSLGLCVIAELLERVLFFRAVTVTRMPGWNINLASHS